MANEIGEPLFTHGHALVGAGPDMLIKYTVPYGWGTLRVSEAADEFYGLVPLTAETVPGESNELQAATASPDFRTDIFLLTPAELAQRVSPDNPESQDLIPANGICMPELHKHGVAIGVTLGENTTKLRQRLIQELAQLDSEERKTVEAAALFAEGVPQSESLERRIPQVQVHKLSLMLGEAATESAIGYLREQNDRTLLRRLTKSGSVMLGALGVMVGLKVGPHDTNPESWAFTGGVAAFYAGLLRSTAKREIGQHSRRNARTPRDAMEIGAVVANAIHETFCSNVFDLRAEQSFGPM